MPTRSGSAHGSLSAPRFDGGRVFVALAVAVVLVWLWWSPAAVVDRVEAAARDELAAEVGVTDETLGPLVAAAYRSAAEAQVLAVSFDVAGAPDGAVEVVARRGGASTCMGYWVAGRSGTLDSSRCPDIPLPPGSRPSDRRSVAPAP